MSAKAREFDARLEQWTPGLLRGLLPWVFGLLLIGLPWDYSGLLDFPDLKFEQSIGPKHENDFSVGFATVLQRIEGRFHTQIFRGLCRIRFQVSNAPKHGLRRMRAQRIIL